METFSRCKQWIKIFKKNDLPDKIEIEGECFNGFQSETSKLNEYFISVSTSLKNKKSSNDYDINITNL